MRLIDDPEQRNFDPTHPRIKDAGKVTPTFTMITPGRRALGEDWSKVTIGHTADEMTLEIEPTEAPVNRKPIVVAHEGEIEMIDYIIEAQRAKAGERSTDELTPQERYQAVNEAWQDYMADKLRWLKGTSTIGAAGLIQRQRVNRRDS